MKPKDIKKKQVQDALKILQEEHARKVQQCANEVTEVLERHGMTMTSLIQIVPKP